MRIRFALLVAALVSATCLRAADPEGFGLWKGSMVANSASQLSSHMDEQKFAWLPMGDYGNHLMGISHREGDGMAELHQTQVDIWIVESGEASVTVGGTIVQPKTVKPHEIRGTSIEGGTVQQLTAGDVVHIPANVPHQLRIPSGKTFTYMVIKVDAK